MRLEPIGFADLPGWYDDDLVAAACAFRLSAEIIIAATGPGVDPLLEAARVALASDLTEGDGARRFFETHFVPHRWDGAREGFLTGYFEPELDGSPTRGDGFDVPVLRRPDDLVDVVDERLRSTAAASLSAGRRAGNGITAYPTRAEIEAGGLAGRGLELLYLGDPVDAYIMHVQGSGLIRFPDGRRLRIGYAGKNGHPYVSIGARLIERGEIAREDMSLPRLVQWLREDADRARALMQENPSYVFFQERGPVVEGVGPVGAMGVPVSPGRSLAVDASLIALGTPVFVVADGLTHHGEVGFRRLMIAQDVGSAIRGPQRGDIFWGTGAQAGQLAGLTRHPGRMIVLLPR
jgi:membrane-bound lytic murein transglycosylase A